MSGSVAYSRDVMWYQSDFSYHGYSHYNLYSGVGGYWGDVGQTVEVTTTNPKKASEDLRDDFASTDFRQCDDEDVLHSFAGCQFKSIKDNHDLLPKSDTQNGDCDTVVSEQYPGAITGGHCKEEVTDGHCEEVVIVGHCEEVVTGGHFEEVVTGGHCEEVITSGQFEEAVISGHCEEVVPSGHCEEVVTGRNCGEIGASEGVVFVGQYEEVVTSSMATGEESSDVISGISMFKRNNPVYDTAGIHSKNYFQSEQIKQRGDNYSLESPDVLLTTMSKDSRPRKSARLMSRSKSEEESKICTKESRKRKAEEDPEEDTNMNKRSKQFRIENQWIPISQDSSITTCTLVPSSHPLTPESEGRTSPDLALGTQFRFRNYLTNSRSSPLPVLSWADSREVWEVMLKKESHYVRCPDMFKNHPSLQSRMRTILLDWLIEVCEVYRLHRETFYLSVDFVDRYLAKSKNIQKHQLQLIGITALFVAAKLEEIYPPKLAEFAYVTDGACTENEILDQELVILKRLNWDLSPLTNIGWLNLYLQVANVEHILELEHGFIFPQYSSHAFIQIARLMDLCILDIGCLHYSYSVIAAAALYHLTSKDIALSVSGFKWQDILPCVNWMAPFATTAREMGPTEMKFFPSVAPEDSHNIQTHAIDLAILEKAQERQEEMINSLRSGSPDLQAQVITQLTPPNSNKKAGQHCDSSSPYSGATPCHSADC